MMAVYFARRKADPDGCIKIGFTRNIDARLRTLSTATIGGMELLASCNGDAGTEHNLHRKLSADRVDGEWFNPSDAVLAEVARAKEAPDPFKERGPNRSKSHLVSPEDEFSPRIETEARFYLNELVKREWRGVGDSPEEARDRVAERFGLSKPKCRKIWYQISCSVDGDTYRILSNEYARALDREGRAEARHQKLLRIEEYFQRSRENGFSHAGEAGARNMAGRP